VLRHYSIPGDGGQVGEFCLTGKSARNVVACLSSPIGKNISVFPNPKSKLYDSLSRPTEGRHAIVTAAGRDAVDADGAADEST
jgi:hypothetical protein